jgi:hypothetical protein
VALFTLNRLEEADGLHGLLEQVPYPSWGSQSKGKNGLADIHRPNNWVKGPTAE